MSAFFLYMNCAVVLVSAAIALLGTSSSRASLACFLVSMFSLVGVLLGVGATVVAIAQLLFAASLGLVCLFAIDTVAGPANATDPSESSWHWLVAVVGVAGACVMGSLLVDLLDVVPPTLAADQVTALASAAPHTNAFEAVGLSVIVDNGLALLVLGLVLLASAVGAGFLASRRSA